MNKNEDFEYLYERYGWIEDLIYSPPYRSYFYVRYYDDGAWQTGFDILPVIYWGA